MGHKKMEGRDNKVSNTARTEFFKIMLISGLFVETLKLTVMSLFRLYRLKFYEICNSCMHFAGHSAP